MVHRGLTICLAAQVNDVCTYTLLNHVPSKPLVVSYITLVVVHYVHFIVLFSTFGAHFKTVYTPSRRTTLLEWNV